MSMRAPPPSNAGKRIVKINALTQAKLIELMLDGTFNCQALAEMTGLHYVTVLHYTRALHRAGAAHIDHYEPDARGRHLIRVYKIGRGKDARRPKQTNAEKAAVCRARRKQAQLGQVLAGNGTFVTAANGRLRFEEVTPCA